MKNKLNILYLGMYLYPEGGALAKRVKNQAEYLSEYANVEIVIPKSGESGKQNKIKYSYTTKTSTFIKIIKYRQKSLSNVLIIETLLNLNIILYALLAKAIGYKIILDKVEDFKYQKKIELSFVRKINIGFGLFVDQFITYFADGLLVISTLLYKKYRNKRIPILLMPNSYHKDAIIENNKKHFNNIIKFIYAGTYGRKDGVEFLIRAFIEINRTNMNIELHLIGKGTDENTERIVKEIGDFSHIIHRHGFVDEEVFQELLLNADVLTVTRTNSKYANYGFPFKLTEYLCTGNPVIATKVGDVELYLKNFENAILVNSEDVKSISEGMLFCIENEKQTIQIGKEGQKIINTLFSIDINGKKLLTFLNSLK